MSARPSTEAELLKALIEEQANDEALWAVYPMGEQPISEAYLQQELRRLHAAAEDALRAWSRTQEAAEPEQRGDIEQIYSALARMRNAAADAHPEWLCGCVSDVLECALCIEKYQEELRTELSSLREEMQRRVREARAEGIDLAVTECRRLMKNGEIRKYLPAYIAALKEAIIFLEPMAIRIRRGEYPHPTTPVAAARSGEKQEGADGS